MTINVHIEHLILDELGIKPHQKKEIKAAVSAELKRLLLDQGLGTSTQSGMRQQSVQKDPILIGKVRKPANFGRQIGKAVYRGIVNHE